MIDWLAALCLLSSETPVLSQDILISIFDRERSEVVVFLSLKIDRQNGQESSKQMASKDAEREAKEELSEGVGSAETRGRSGIGKQSSEW